MIVSIILIVLKIISYLLLIAVLGTISWYILSKLIPSVEIRIIPGWVNERDGLLILRIEIANHSLVRIRKQHLWLQCLEKSYPESGRLSEWVPFTRNEINPNEKPIQWNDPIEIFKSTNWLNPGAVINIERLHQFNPNNVLHLAVKFIARPGFIERYILRMHPPTTSWTATAIVVRSRG